MHLKNFNERLMDFISHPCFNDGVLIPNNPYQRALRTGDFWDVDLTKPITITDVISNKNLLVHKLLNTIYEQDLLLIDDSFNTEEGYHDYELFYDSTFVALGKSIKPMLERCAFSFLDQEIEIIGQWTKNNFSQYVNQLMSQYDSQPILIFEVIKASSQPELAAKKFLIQMTSDFLTEASAMGRALLGSFGAEQSEMMKIFIDEYGYGVHQRKHSTLFEKMLIAADLNPRIHAYYNDYLPTSLMLGNYFHYLCSNRALHFRHLGALYYSEAVIPHFNRVASKTIKRLIPIVDTTYFDEHVHIDAHHQRMVLEKLILPSIDRYGESIIEDILIGMESQRLLNHLAEEDCMAQMQFCDAVNEKTKVSMDNYEKIGNQRNVRELKGEVTSGHLHSEAEFFSVIEGSLDFYTSALSSVKLHAGDSIVIPKGRLHSTIVQSDRCHYTVQSIHENKMEVAA